MEIMNLEFLSGYFVPVIAGICLCAGSVMKQWVDDVDNRMIPAVNAVLGLLLSLWIHWGAVTPEVILAGLFSGLASTGLYEMFRNLVGGKNE